MSNTFFEGAVMFWNLFFEGAIYLKFMAADLLDSFILSKRFKLRTELEKNVNMFLLKFSPQVKSL